MEANERKALIKTLASSLFIHGRIKTSTVKAKALRPFVERLITHAKTKTPASTRLISRRLGNKDTAALVVKMAPKYAERKGGYTRVIKTENRRSDGAAMAFIELV